MPVVGEWVGVRRERKEGLEKEDGWLYLSACVRFLCVCLGGLA